jgi:hypothetical protein
MSDDEKTSNEQQSLLDESSETQPTADMSILSSTINQDENTGVVRVIHMEEKQWVHHNFKYRTKKIQLK